MKILAIDSSGPVASAAILENDQLLSECTVNYKMKHSTTLLPLIDYAAKLVQLDLNTVDAIAITAGPGSFTGLRIGSATAKGLGLAMDKPIIPVPTLSALAYGLCGSDALICPIMDARREQVYNALYRFEGNEMITLTEQRPIYMKDVIEEVNAICGGKQDPEEASPEADAEGQPGREKNGNPKRVIFLGDGVPVYREMIEANIRVPYTFAPAHQNRQRAGAVGALAMRLAKTGVIENADEHSPFYLRKSQAEQEKERAAKAAEKAAEN